MRGVSLLGGTAGALGSIHRSGLFCALEISGAEYGHLLKAALAPRGATTDRKRGRPFGG